MSRRGRPGLSVRMDPEMLDALKALAQERGITLTSLIESIVRAYLDAESQK